MEYNVSYKRLPYQKLRDIFASLAAEIIFKRHKGEWIHFVLPSEFLMANSLSLQYVSKEILQTQKIRFETDDSCAHNNIALSLGAKQQHLAGRRSSYERHSPPAY